MTISNFNLTSLPSINFAYPIAAMKNAHVTKGNNIPSYIRQGAVNEHQTNHLIDLNAQAQFRQRIHIPTVDIKTPVHHTASKGLDQGCLV